MHTTTPSAAAIDLLRRASRYRNAMGARRQSNVRTVADTPDLRCAPRGRD
jgi:hypothetical protein